VNGLSHNVRDALVGLGLFALLAIIGVVCVGGCTMHLVTIQLPARNVAAVTTQPAGDPLLNMLLDASRDGR